VSECATPYLHQEPSPIHNRITASSSSLSRYHRSGDHSLPVQHQNIVSDNSVADFPPVIAELLEEIRKFETQGSLSHSPSLYSTRSSRRNLQLDPWEEGLSHYSDLELSRRRRQLFQALSSASPARNTKPGSFGAGESFTPSSSSRRNISLQDRHFPSEGYFPYSGQGREKSVSFSEVQRTRFSKKVWLPFTQSCNFDLFVHFLSSVFFCFLILSFF
jgi:hypothetical protein